MTQQERSPTRPRHPTAASWTILAHLTQCFFAISLREAEQTDPMHRLALVTAYETLEHAGYVHGRGMNTRRVGIIDVRMGLV